ncbi:hypothetical protein ACFLS5_02230 [Candidatus Bipolaricaulota bacterium]
MRHSPLVEAIFDELRRRQDEDEPQDGKALTDHFERIPFGWPEALVRLVLAAMLRGGSINVHPQTADRPLHDPTDPRVDALFKKLSQFRKARFRAVVGALTPVEVKQTKEKLVQLGVPNPPDNTHALAEKIRACGNDLLQRNARMEQRAADLELPLPVLTTVCQTVSEVLDEHDPVALVRRFIEPSGQWNELHALVQDYDQFVKSGRDREFRTYADVAGIAREVSALASDLEAELRTALDEFGAIVEQRAILTKWKPLCDAARTIVERLAAAYLARHSECATAIVALRKELEALPDYAVLDENRRASILEPYLRTGGPLSLPAISADDFDAERLLDACRKAGLTQLELMVKAIPIHRREIIAALETAARGIAGDGKAADRRPVHRVHLRERLLGRRFLDKKSFQEEWNKLEDEIVAKLDQDFEVVMDE